MLLLVKEMMLSYLMIDSFIGSKIDLLILMNIYDCI